MILNATFELSSAPNIINVIQYATESNGYTHSLELDAGTYYYREHFVPEPLIIDTAIKTVDIKAGQNHEVTATNEVAHGQIQLEKCDKETSEFLSNAKYTIYKDSSLNEVVEILKINGAGQTNSSILILGTCYLKETKEPSGYLVNDTVCMVDLNLQESKHQGALNDLSIADQVIKGKIQIVKVE